MAVKRLLFGAAGSSNDERARAYFQDRRESCVCGGAQCFLRCFDGFGLRTFGEQPPSHWKSGPWVHVSCSRGCVAQHMWSVGVLFDVYV